MLKLQSLLGLFALILIAWGLSENRKNIDARAIAGCLALQIGLAFFLLTIPIFKDFLLYLNKAAQALQESTNAGTSFVFGYLGGGKTPFKVSDGSNIFILAFQALPLVLVISALSSVLFYWRILPAIVKALAFGADFVMVGSLLAGTRPTPGSVLTHR